MWTRSFSAVSGEWMLFLHIFQQFKSSLPTLERFQRRYHPLTVLVLLVETSFAWADCCPITDHVIFPRDLFFYPSKNYLFIYTQLFGKFEGRILKSIITWSEMGQQTAQSTVLVHTWILVILLSQPILLGCLILTLTPIRKVLFCVYN